MMQTSEVRPGHDAATRPRLVVEVFFRLIDDDRTVAAARAIRARICWTRQVRGGMSPAGAHKQVDRMQTRAELYELIGCHDFEALDASIVRTLIPQGISEK